MSNEFAKNNDPEPGKSQPGPSASVSNSDPPGSPGPANGNGADHVDRDRDPFEALASEFAERQRMGEKPSIEEYALAHPEHAAEIRELFPTIAVMEQLKERNTPPSHPMLGGLPLEQLGDFRILGEIGRGGMGVVYEAEQVSLGRHVAVKVLPKQALLDERHLRRFQREAQTAAKLHHTNIVPVFGVGQQDGYHYIVMQFIPGVGLDEVLVALRRIVLGDGQEAVDVDSSNRASHASLNAKALLGGQFDGQQQGGFSGSLIKSDSSSDKLPRSGATLPMASTSIGRKPCAPADGSLDTGGGTSSWSSLQIAKLSGGQYYRSVANIGAQVADALCYAHQHGTLHRDIKPGNLLLDSTGTVWVADFGLAKLAEHDNVSRTGDIVGTLGYMAPESFSGETDARADIYSLGITLYEMLILRPAFHGRDRGKLVRQITQGELVRPRRLNPSVPRDLETIVLKAIAERPDDRYATAGEFTEDLHRYLEDLPILARRASPPERLWRWCRRNRLVASLTALVLSLLVLVAVISSAGYFRVRASEADARAAAAEAQRAEADAVTARKTAEDEQKNAVQTARMAMQSLLTVFNRLAPDRLPLSADNSLQEAELPEEDGSTANTENLVSLEEQPEVVAPPPVTEETAAILELMLVQDFDALSKRAGNEEEFAEIFAQLTLRVGKVYQVLGNSDEAQRFFEHAIAKFEFLARQSGSPSAWVGLAMSYNELGRVLSHERDGREAMQMHEKALGLLTDHADALDDYPLAQYEQARTLFLMSVRRQHGPRMASRRGGRGEGRRGHSPYRSHAERLAEAIGILESLSDQDPVPEYRYLLARCYLAKSGGRPRFGRRRAEDRQAVEDAVSLLEDLVDENPQVADFQFELAMAYARSVSDRFGVTDEDEDFLTKSTAIFDALTAGNASVIQYAESRVGSLWRLARTLDLRAANLADAGKEETAKQKHEEAANAYDRVHQARRQFAERFPNEPSNDSFARFDVRFNHARALARIGRDKRAISMFEDIMENPHKDGEQRRNSHETTIAVNAARWELSRVLTRAGDHEGASQRLAKAHAELEASLEEVPPDIKSHRDWERWEAVVALLVEVLEDQGQSAAAVKLLVETAEKKLAAVEQRVDDDGRGFHWSQLQLARARLQLGWALREAGRIQEADKILRASKSDLDNALSSLSEDNDLRRIFITALLAEVLEELGDTDRAQDLRASLPEESRRHRAEFGGSRWGRGRTRY